FSLVISAGVAFGVSPACHRSAVTPAWLSHAVMKREATVFGLAAPALTDGPTDGPVPPASGSTALSSPRLRSAEPGSDADGGATTGPTGSPARVSPMNALLIPTMARTSTASTRAIPYRV